MNDINFKPKFFADITKPAEALVLARLVDAVAPEMVIPIHSFHPERFKDYFTNVRLVDDGEIVVYFNNLAKFFL